MIHSQPVVEVNGLVKRYDGAPVVDAVDLHVQQGEIFGVLGHNGAGKTTIVECIQGLRTPDAGSIQVLGRDPTRDRERLRASIGSQLQDSALPDRMQVREAVELFSTRRCTDAGELLSAWGLADKQRTPFAKLSGGQQQRLLIALALLNSPRIVFLDELTRGLDPAARRETWAAIRRVRDEGTTVVLVTHFTDEAEALCDRVIVMRHGRVVASGTPVGLINDHARTARVSLAAGAQVSHEHKDLERIDGVDRVETDGEGVDIVGSSHMIPYVCAELVARNLVNGDLRITQPTLEDALLEMTGGNQ